MEFTPWRKGSKIKLLFLGHSTTLSITLCSWLKNPLSMNRKLVFLSSATVTIGQCWLAQRTANDPAYLHSVGGGGCLLLCGRVLTRALQYKGRCNALWYAWFLCQRVLRTWADAGRWHWLGTGGWGRMTHPMIDLWSHGFGVSSTSNAIVYAFDSQEFSLLKFKHRNITCHRKISRNLIPFYSKWLISQ